MEPFSSASQQAGLSRARSRTEIQRTRVWESKSVFGRLLYTETCDHELAAWRVLDVGRASDPLAEATYAGQELTG